MKTAFRDNSIIALVSIAFVLTLIQIFVLTPNEQSMGAVQRIIYIHLGAAVMTYVTTLILCGGSIAWLSGKNSDAVMCAAVSVGFLFASIVMATGMIWGQVAWNTMFRLEPRLVTAFLLWFIYVAMVLLRQFGDPSRIPAHTAVLGICATLIVPAVMYSGRLLSQSEQLHPQVLRHEGGLAPEFVRTLQVSIAATVALGLLLFWIRFRLARLDGG